MPVAPPAPPVVLRDGAVAIAGRPVLRGIDREAALIIGEEAGSLPGVVVEVEPIRRYLDETGAPNGSLMAHIVGYTGPVSPDELARGRLVDRSTAP